MKKNHFLMTALAAFSLCSPVVAADDVITLLEKAQEGDAQAQYELGVRYYKGDGVKKDSAKALRWYQLAAAQGHERAKLTLDILGANSSTADTPAPAAAPSSAEEQYNQGLRYFNGEGVPQDFAEAAKCFKLAAEQGYAFAQYALGVCYANDQGVTQNDAEAAKWYKLAAEQGNEDAKSALQSLAANGSSEAKDKLRKLGVKP